jgi:hypothetical protein
MKIFILVENDGSGINVISDQAVAMKLFFAKKDDINLFEIDTSRLTPTTVLALGPTFSKVDGEVCENHGFPVV